MHHTRNYSYDDESASYPSGHVPPHQGSSFTVPPSSYHRGQYDATAGQHYVPSNAPPHPQYSRSMTVSPEAQHYAAMQQGYMPNGPSYYDPSYNQSSQSPIVNSQTPQFIPTPSDFVGPYPNFSNGRPVSPTHFPHRDYYASPEYQQQLASSSQFPLHASRYPASRPRSTVPLSPNSTSSTGERFPCEKCGKTFSRSHDRKRHYETQHLATPIIHRCRYCDKEFSRADSLKRHLDNGCDERPQ